MLYHGKPGKASPNRWHKFWFLVKDAFSDEVRYYFCTVHTNLEYEESPELAEGLKKLEEGFPETLPMDVFCDLDFLIKVGLSKGVENFPDMDLVPSSSGAPAHIEETSQRPKGPKERSSPLLSTPTPADQVAVNLEVLSPKPSPLREVPPSPDRFHRVPSWNVTEESLRVSEGLASWANQKRGFENNHPLFVDPPYTLPSGFHITQDSVAKATTSLAAEMLKNYMLRPSVLGVLRTPPLNLFDCFSYHQVKAVKAVYALSLRLSDSSKRDDEVTRLKASLASTEKERDEALSKRDELANLYQKQCSERENLLADARETSEVYKTELERWEKHSRGLEAKIEDHQFHITEAQDMLKGYYDKVGSMEAEIGGLQMAMGTTVEKLKQSEEYRNLLKGDTTTLLRSFCEKVVADSPGISTHFTNFITTLGEDYVVSLFEELPEEEEPAESEDTSESDSSEDEGGDES
ncbi:hypothetical protein LIER_43675 [Lithospermum erythrorhizon]|uniref:Uncharacterized protein n=1 Tax=Lithospermum erythrorhizon TaxID=34254 RepID=A0AAV3QMP1_LITER